MSQLEIIKKVKEECHNEYGNKYHYQGKCKGETAICDMIIPCLNYITSCHYSET